MTNKKFKIAAMSMALTACVAAQPLLANAADETDTTSSNDAPAQTTDAPAAEEQPTETKGHAAEQSTVEGQPVEQNGETESTPSGQNSTGGETEQPDGANKEGENTEDLLGDADVKYDHDNPKKDLEAGSTTITGEVVKKDDAGSTDPDKKSDGTGETGSTTPAADTGKTEIDPDKKPSPGHIGSATKTETDTGDTTVTNPKPGAQPEVDPDKDSSAKTEDDGTIIINTPTRVPATEETTSTGKGTATADMDATETTGKITKDELQKELGGALPTWETKKDDTFGEGEDDAKYKVIDDKLSEDGNSKEVKLEKTTTTTTDMTAEDIAKLLEAEATEPDEDGNYTLTRDKMETTDENGNKITRITYITVDPGSGKVTTKTVTELTVTLEKGKQTVDKTFSEDEKDYTKSDAWSEKTTIEDNKGNKYEVSLKDLLKDTKDEELKSALASGGSITVSGEDGLTYEITFGQEKTDGQLDLSPTDLARLLNTDYDVIDGKLYYIGEGLENKSEVKAEEFNALQKSLSVTIKVTKKTSQSGTEITGDKAAAEAEAKLDALKNALVEAAKKEGLTLDKSTMTDVTLDGTSWTYTKDGKTYTFTYEVSDTVTDGGKHEVTGVTIEDGKHDQVDRVWDNIVNGSATVTGSTITSTKNDFVYDTTGKLSIGSTFDKVPEDADAATIKREDGKEDGRITSYVDADGKTHTFTYKTITDKSQLTEAERTALTAKAEAEGWTLDDLLLNEGFTRVSWEVSWNEHKETPVKEEIHDETIDLIKKDEKDEWNYGRTEDSDGKWNFTYKNGHSDTDMTLSNTSVSEKDGIKTTTETFTKTDANGDNITITVTTRQMSEAELQDRFNEKFHGIKYTLDTTNKTVTYVNEKGETITARYNDLVQTMNRVVSVQQAVAGTGNTEQDAINNFLKNLEDAYNKAKEAGETLIVRDPSGKLPDLEIKPGVEWKEEVRRYVENVVNFKAMNDADLINYLTKLKEDADSSKTSYTGDSENNTLYYFDEDGKSYHVSETEKDERGNITKVRVGNDWKNVEHKWVWDFIGGHYESNIKYGPNYIDHLDLATDSNLTLAEKDEKGNFKTDDCVLVEKTLEWNTDANDLVHNPESNRKVGLLDRITYDNENDNDSKTGHYEYPRASWFDWDTSKDNAPKSSAYYKVTGTVAYGKYGSAFKAGWNGSEYYWDDAAAKKAADIELAKIREQYKDARIVTIYDDQNRDSKPSYQIYLYESKLTAYGYLSDSSNTCGNAHYEPGNKNSYVGGFDLTLGNLTQVSKEEIVAVGKNVINCSATFTRIKQKLDKENRSLTYAETLKEYTETEDTPHSESGNALSGSYRYEKENTDLNVTETGSGSYRSYEYTDTETATGKATTTVTRKDGFVRFIYRTIKDAFVSDATKTETVKKDAEVKYTYTTVVKRDTYVPGEDQITIITPDENGGGDDGGTVIEENNPILPSTPELPPVQDARPDAPVLPSDPVLPPVQDAHFDAALPQTGVNWLTAIGLALSGMTLMAAGAFAALTGKNKKEQQ